MSFDFGFTGTREGMTEAQRQAVREIVGGLPGALSLHHGDCVGADEEVHRLVRKIRPFARIVGHPPSSKSLRAFCAFDEERAAKHYLYRNKQIVAEGEDLLVATPKEGREVWRSGTWSTIRYAIKSGRRLIVVLPDGTRINSRSGEAPRENREGER